ncbi:phosphatase PAP2 family protein [Solicola gregarius]|uniref:phosphatase PAP2 family protein n=1 Tax=Solicola gregarius TaxID=2908642 RepID=UPI0038CD81FC
MHVSVVLTVCLLFHQSGMSRWLCNIAWVYLVGTVLATLYFGWHYVADDIGGAVIAVVSVWIGAKVTGQPTRRSENLERAGPAAESVDTPRE